MIVEAQSGWSMSRQKDQAPTSLAWTLDPVNPNLIVVLR